MATVVAVTDGDGNTDNIVVVDPRRRRLLWVPRDVWSPLVGFRINAAYPRGGVDLLVRALGELGLPVEHAVCVPREGSEAFLADVVVTVPVREPVRLWYPLAPRARIEDGRKRVDFDPPRAVLSGERIHQWIGGRTSRVRDDRLPDLVRIERQQVFVRALLHRRVDLTPLLVGDAPAEVSDPAAIDELRRVRWWWRFRAVDAVEPTTIDGAAVLLVRSLRPRRHWGARARRLARRGRAALGRMRRRVMGRTGRGSGASSGDAPS